MRNPIALVRILSLAGLVIASASLTLTEMQSEAFCPLASDCGTVMNSRYGILFGVPVAALGLVGFGSIFVASLLPPRKVEVSLTALCILAGCAGLALLMVQVMLLKQICVLCVAADLCGIALLGTTVFFRRTRIPETTCRSRVRWLAAAAFLGALPMAWTAAQGLGSRVPGQVRAHWKPDQITVVEVTDFECPYCARADEMLKSVLRDYAKIHLVRLPAPMPKYANSRIAAKAYLAACRQGKGDEMAEALYRAESRSAQDCRELALAVDLTMSDYNQAMHDPSFDAELDATIAWAERFQRLPLIWVQDRLFARVPSESELRGAIQRAKIP